MLGSTLTVKIYFQRFNRVSTPTRLFPSFSCLCPDNSKAGNPAEPAETVDIPLSVPAAPRKPRNVVNDGHRKVKRQ